MPFLVVPSMKEVLVIQGESALSPVLSVMYAVLYSFKDIRIHTIVCGNMNVDVPEDTEFMKYHAVDSVWTGITIKTHKLTKYDAKYIFDDLNIFLDSFFLLGYERRLLKLSRNIISNNNISAVFSVMNPVSAHKVGVKISKEYPHIPYFQFWLDQFTGRRKHANSLIRKALYNILENRKEAIEYKLLKSVDKFYMLPEVFVNDRIANCFREKLVSFEIPYIKNRIVQSATKDVVFAGFLGGSIRQPEPMLDVIISSLPHIDNDIYFHFYVNDPDSLRYYEVQSSKHVLFHNYISREELEEKLSNALMLICIGNKGSDQMPSKTVEYVGYRKPILFFYAEDNDTSLRYFNYYPDVCKIDVRNKVEYNSQKMIDYMNNVHRQISYEDLMGVKVFRESTPDYVRQIISL